MMSEENDKRIPIYKPGDICREIHDDPSDTHSGKVFYIAEAFERFLDLDEENDEEKDSLGIYYNCWVWFPHAKMSGKDSWGFSYTRVPERYLTASTKRIAQMGEKRNQMIFVDR